MGNVFWDTGSEFARLPILLRGPGATGNGILPLTGGARRIRTVAEEAALPQMSGQVLEVDPPWCCVSGVLGVIYGPSGSARHEVPTSYLTFIGPGGEENGLRAPTAPR